MQGLKQTQLPLSPPLPESVITVTEECEEVWESHPKPMSDGTQRVCDDVKIDSTSSIDYKMITEGNMAIVCVLQLFVSCTV